MRSSSQKITYAGLLVIVAMLTLPCGLIHAGSSSGEITAKIVQFGIYDVDFNQAKKEETASALIGFGQRDVRPKLVESTTVVNASLHTAFGIRVQISGDSSDKSVTYLQKVIHPEIVNPNTKKATTVDQWQNDMPLGRVQYNGWSFEKPWELVPGKWTIQIICNSRVIAEKSFVVKIAK
jgi:hypothetical protein